MNEDLDNLLTNLSLIESEHLKKLEIFRILDLIKSYEIESFYKYYLKGYLWYKMPIESKKRDQEVEKNLKKSISQNPNYLISKSYLSYFYFDKKEFKKVINILKSINFSFFVERNQIWQSLKLQELLIVSKLYISESVNNDLSGDLLGLISSYLNLPEEEIAVPTELINAVIENKYKKGIMNVRKNTYLLVNSKSQKDYFSDDVRLELFKSS